MRKEQKVIAVEFLNILIAVDSIPYLYAATVAHFDDAISR